MTRSLLPPDCKAFVSSNVLFDYDLAATIRDTYTMLRMLAWGKAETPELSWGETEQKLGKDRQSVYRHMLTLVNIGAMRWRSASVGTFIVTFTDGLHGAANCLVSPRSSQRRESPLNSLTSSEQKESESYKGRRGVGRKGILKNEMTPAGKAMLLVYVEMLGYDPENATPDDIRALNWLGEHYTVEQVRKVYATVKAEPFWRSRQITPRRLRIDVAEHLRPDAGRIGDNHAAHQRDPNNQGAEHVDDFFRDTGRR